MGYNLQYIYRDENNSFENFWIKLISTDKVRNYLETRMFGINISIARTNNIVEIFTTYKYSDYNKKEIEPLEDKLCTITQSPIYRLNESLLDKWNDISVVEYWEDDEELIHDFFDWVQTQDPSQWAIVTQNTLTKE